MNAKIAGVFMLLAFFLATAGCQDKTGRESPACPEGARGGSLNAGKTPVPAGKNRLVAYFSGTGNTGRIAQWVAQQTGADVYQITPEIPYTPADLNYRDSASRATREQNDPAARPRIAGPVNDIGKYDTIFLGYPIWWGQAPRIVQTFLESHDLSGKTIVPFVTSHSSGIDNSDTRLHKLAPFSTWKPGKRFSAQSSRETVNEWAENMTVSAKNTQDIGIFDFEKKTVLLNSGYQMPIVGLGTYSLSDEASARSVSEHLKAGGRLIDTAFIYRNERGVGQGVRQSGVPREDVFVITKLYPSQYANAGSAIDEALERLDLGYIDMMLLHHPGTHDVEAYRAMERAMKDGKIRSLGLSCFYIAELDRFLPQITIMPALVQNEIHPYYQDNEVTSYIQGKGIVVQGWYPLGGRGYTAELLTNPTISDIARSHNKSSAQIILRWNLQKSVVVIPGSSNPDHIRENLDLFDFALSDEEMARINALDRHEKHDWY